MDHNCNWKWTSDAARFTDELVPDWLADYCSPPMLWVIIKSSWPVSCNWWMADVLLWAWRVAPSVSSPVNATGVECSQSYLDRCLLKMQPLLDSPLTKGIPHTQEAVLASCRYHLLFQLFYKGEMIESFPPTETFSPPPSSRMQPSRAPPATEWLSVPIDWLTDWLIDWVIDWWSDWLTLNLSYQVSFIEITINTCPLMLSSKGADSCIIGDECLHLISIQSSIDGCSLTFQISPACLDSDPLEGALLMFWIVS